jgi:hypothetical protein
MDYRKIIRREGKLFVKGKNGYYNLDKTIEGIKNIESKKKNLTGKLLKEVAERVLEDKPTDNTEKEAVELSDKETNQIKYLYDPNNQTTIDPFFTFIDEYNGCVKGVSQPLGKATNANDVINYCNKTAEKWTKIFSPMSTQEEYGEEEEGGRKLRNKKNKKTRKNHKRATKRKQIKKRRTRSK